MSLPARSRSPGHGQTRRHASCWLALLHVGAPIALGTPVEPAVAQVADGVWASPWEHPGPRWRYCAVYDPIHGRMIVFGGSGQRLDQVWTLSLGDRPEWSSHVVGGPVPAPRSGASAIFDPLRDRVILFENDELWALSLSGVPSWTPLQAGGEAPSARTLHSAVYDSKRDRMIVFGGDHAGTRLGDVWTLDLSNGPTWAPLVVRMPGAMPRRWHAATYDPVNDRMLVFGGEGLTFGYRNDCWELRLSGEPTWGRIFSTGPPSRFGGTLLYDPVDDRAILLGGGGGFGSDLWLLPAATGQWSEVSPHPYLQNGQGPAIFDSARRRVVVYNGLDALMVESIGMVGSNHLFSWLIPTPGPRDYPSVVHDPKRERMLMTLGATQDGLSDQTWALSLSGTEWWSVLPTGGAFGQAFQTAIFDPIRDRLIVFGGYNSNETWELRLAGSPGWDRLSPGGDTPGPRQGHSVIYDPRRDRMIVFGGLGQFGSRNAAHSLSLGGTLEWSSLPPGPPRVWHSTIYDPVGDRMLVIGGAANNWSGWSNEVWSLSLAEPIAWSLLAPAGEAPAPRYESSASYDPIRHRVVLYGGCCLVDEEASISTTFGDSWELALDGPPRWRRMTSPGAPQGRRAAHLIYDPPRDRAILFGGLDADDDFPVHDDSWSLTWGNPVRPSVSAPGDVAPGTPLILSYLVHNPLPGPRAIEWTLTGERHWPGFPLRGVQVVEGASSRTVRVEVRLPFGSFDAPNTLTFAAGYSGAPGHVSSVQHLIQGRPAELTLRLATPVVAAGGRLRVELTLRDRSPARLELLDVVGRRLLARHVGSLGPGAHVLDLSEGRALGSGIYFLRLSQAGEEVRARAVMIR